jgi:hypothetical protein
MGETASFTARDRKSKLSAHRDNIGLVAAPAAQR